MSAVDEDDMSVSGSRAAVDIDLDDFEKRLRVAGTASSSVEDPLAELTRLVEASRPRTAEPAARVAAPPPPPPSAAYAVPLHPIAPVSRAPVPPATVPPAPAAPIEAVDLRPALDDTTEQDFADEAEETFASSAEPEPEILAHPAARPRPRRWLLTVSTLAIAGVAMIGAVFVLKGGMPGLQKAPPFIAAAQGRPECSRRATPPSRMPTTPARPCSRTTRSPTRSRSSATRSSRSI